MYAAKILADSLSPAGVRLITVEATFPRFILAEVNTHRMLSRNSASSRAIPPEQLLERVSKEPFIPETFNKRVKGMGVGNPLEGDERFAAREAWLEARVNAVRSAERLLELDVDKSRINRLLEPFMWHTAIITATEWDNFFTLRDHPAAQPEFQKIAQLMREAMIASTPQVLGEDDWHLPLVDPEEKKLWSVPAQRDKLYWARVSAGRCARVSFDKQHNYETPEESYSRQRDTLEKNGHLSPAEHPARPSEPRFIGNLMGWVQLRKLIPYEENLVGHLEGKHDWEEVTA